MLLLMKPPVIHHVSRQIAFGLHDLLKTNAANIHSSQDWYTLFTLLEVVGAGTNPPPLMQANAGINVPESLSDAGNCKGFFYAYFANGQQGSYVFFHLSAPKVFSLC